MKPTSILCFARSASRLSRWTLGASLGLAALAVAPTQAQTLAVSGSLHAAVLRTDLAPLTGSPFITSYPWQDVQTGGGSATQVSGFTSITDALSTEAARLTYSLTDLTLTSYTGGGPSFSTEVYTPKAGATFSFFYDGATLASGEVVSLEVTTNFTTGVATGLGSIRLTAPGGISDFYDEIGLLTGGSFLMDFSISSFTAVNGTGDFNSIGTFSASAVPEPATWASLAGGVALLLAAGRRRRVNRVSL